MTKRLSLHFIYAFITINFFMNHFCIIPLVLVCFVSICICFKIFLDFFFFDPLVVQECVVYILFIPDTQAGLNQKLG